MDKPYIFTADEIDVVTHLTRWARKMKRSVMIDLPDVVYLSLLHSAARNGWTPEREIEHLIMRQFDRDYSQAEFDKLVQEIRRGCKND